MGTKLARISELSEECPNIVFTSIGHLIDVEMLTECHRDMDGKKAVGIDGITKDMYEANLKENLVNLVNRLKAKNRINQSRQEELRFQKIMAKPVH